MFTKTKPTFLNCGLVIMLIVSLLSTSLLTIFPAQAAPLTQSTGYWRYVKTNNVVFADSADYTYHKGDKIPQVDSISAGGGSYSVLTTHFPLESLYPGSGEVDYIFKFSCTWKITSPPDDIASPTNLNTLFPGDAVEASMSCTDTSLTAKPDGNGYGSSLEFKVAPPGISDYTNYYDDNPVIIRFGYQESKAATGALVIPSLGDLGSVYNASNGRIALMFVLGFVGYSERIYEWVSGLPPTSTPTLTPVPITGKKPCPEAVQKYALDPNKPTQMQYDYADLQKQFEQALQKYETNNIQKAYVQDNIAGTLPALSWLANQGGTVNLINKQFVFTSDTDREKWRNKIPRADQVTPGNERSLYEAMFSAAAPNPKNGKKLTPLTPGDVFYLALVQRNGNAKEAMLLAHNTLRSLSRIVDRGIFGNDDQTLTQVEYSPGFVSEYLAPVIKQGPLGPGQNEGAWYHLFGMTYFEMQARGTWGAYTLVQVTGDQSLDELNEKVREMLKVLKQDPELKSPANRSIYADLANDAEQLARKYVFKSPDDPLKYCHNVWGAQLGSWLYQKRLEIKPAIQAPPPPPRGVTKPTIFGDLPVGSPPVDDNKNQANWEFSSPMNVTWENNQYKMALDQKSNSLYGYFPIDIFPYYEEDTKTWGMMWVQTGSEDYRITLEATQDGWGHITRSDNGQVLVYSIPLKVGDQFTLDISASQPAPALVRSNGQKIMPLDLTSAASNSPDGSGACAQLQASRVSWLARDASGQQLNEVSAYPSGTKEIIPAFVYPCAPSSATIITQLSRDGKSVSFKSDLTASSTEGWFYLPLAYDTAYTDGLYEVSFYVAQALLGSGQVRIGDELVTNTEMVVNGLVLDDATQKPLAKAWVAVLLPGMTAMDWQDLGFPDNAVLAYGQSDSQGQFSLVNPVDMATPVYLERNIAYSVFAWLDGYQNMLADDLIIGDSQSSPVKLTITMRR